MRDKFRDLRVRHWAVLIPGKPTRRFTHADEATDVEFLQLRALGETGLHGMLFKFDFMQVVALIECLNSATRAHVARGFAMALAETLELPGLVSASSSVKISRINVDRNQPLTTDVIEELVEGFQLVACGD